MGRVLLAGYPHHVVQRGHNRQVVFAVPGDCQRYLDMLSEYRAVYGIKVYAWCSVTNHVHLLLAPGEEVATLGRLMKRLAGRQTRHHSRLEGRSDSLWEGSTESSPVNTEPNLLACVLYIELNPMRARMLARPEAYRWSNCGPRLGGAPCPWLDHDPCYLALGATDEERQLRFRVFPEAAMAEGERSLIREAVQRSRLTGSSRFVSEVERILGRRIEKRPRGGRPRRRPCSRRVNKSNLSQSWITDLRETRSISAFSTCAMEARRTGCDTSKRSVPDA